MNRLNFISNTRLKLSWVLIFTITIAFAAYWKALNNFFYNDDFAFILMANSVRMFDLGQFWHNVKIIINPSWFKAEFVFFFINTLLIKALGTHAILYHAHNILFHAVNSFLVFFIAHKLTNSYKFSFLACLFFILNPLHAEAVYWYSGFHTLLVTLFMLLAILNYASAFYKSSALFLFLAMCTKPDACVLLGYIVLIDLYLFGFKIDKIFLKRISVFLALSAFAFVISALYYANITHTPAGSGFTLASIFDLGRLFKNLSYFLLPVRRIFYFAIPALVFLLFLIPTKEEKKIIIFCVAFLILSLMPYQIFIPDVSFYYLDVLSRYFYMPALGQAFLWAALLKIILSRSNLIRRILIYSGVMVIFILNLTMIRKLDSVYEDNEFYNKILYRDAEAYLKNHQNKIILLFDADPKIVEVFDPDFHAISATLFNYKLISVYGLSTYPPPNNQWIMEKYPNIPKKEEVSILEFRGKKIYEVGAKQGEEYYKIFAEKAKLLYERNGI